MEGWMDGVPCWEFGKRLGVGKGDTRIASPEKGAHGGEYCRKSVRRMELAIEDRMEEFEKSLEAESWIEGGCLVTLSTESC
jgi:hypothetical protein